MARKKGVEAGRAYVKAWFDDSLVKRGLTRMKANFAAAGSGLMKVGGGLLGAGAGLAGLFVAPIKAAAQLETTRASYTTLLGSAEKAKTVLADLQKFSAATPFEMPELADAGKKLLAFNVTAEEMIPTLRKVGDISAGIGAPIGEIAELYGKAKVQGRLFGEDINQLTGRGIPIIQELAKQFGVAETDVKKLVETGKVNFTHLEKAFTDLTAEGGKFGGMMDAQSKTLAGRWSSMMDNLTQAMIPVGEAVLPVIGGIVDRVASGAQALTKWLTANAGIVKMAAAGAAAIFAFGAAFAAAGVAFSLAASVIGGIVATVGFLLSPVGLAIGAIAALTAGLGYAAHKTGLLGEAVEWLKTQFGPLIEQVKTAFKGIQDAIAADDWKAAAEIAWAALRAVWTSGKNWLLATWDSITNYIGDTWAALAAGIRAEWMVLQSDLARLMEWAAEWKNAALVAAKQLTNEEAAALNAKNDKTVADALNEATAAKNAAKAADRGAPSLTDSDPARRKEANRRVNRGVARQDEQRAADAALAKLTHDARWKADAARAIASSVGGELWGSKAGEGEATGAAAGAAATARGTALNTAVRVGSTEGADALARAMTGRGDGSERITDAVEQQTKVIERHHRDEKRWPRVVLGKVKT